MQTPARFRQLCSFKKIDQMKQRPTTSRRKVHDNQAFELSGFNQPAPVVFDDFNDASGDQMLAFGITARFVCGTDQTARDDLRIDDVTSESPLVS